MKAYPLSMSHTVDSTLLSRGSELPNTPQSPPETTEFLLTSALLFYKYRFDDYNLQFTLSTLAASSMFERRTMAGYKLLIYKQYAVINLNVYA